MVVRKALLFSLLLGTSAVLLDAPDATAQSNQWSARYSQQAVQQVLRYVDELEVQGQRMTTEALQIAMHIDTEESLRRFEDAHEFFVEVLHNLQTGDETIGLPVPHNPDLIASLEALQQIWDQLDANYQRVKQNRSATRTDIVMISQFDNVLIDVSRQVEESYEHLFARTNLASMATTTVVKAEHQVFLIERMQSELLLITFGHDADAERAKLTESAAQFDQTLEELIAGNPGQMLMPPPNDTIKTQLRAVQRGWDDVRHDLLQVAQGASADKAAVTSIVRRMEALYEQMEHAVDAYAPPVRHSQDSGAG